MPRTVEPFLGEVNDLLLRMGGCAEAILAKALRALAERSAALAAEVQEDDLEIDRLDVAIDDAVLRSIALQAPVADDLRRLLAAYDMATNLERVGDIARNIAKAAARMAEQAPLAPPASFEALVADSQAMLRDALDAFVQRDTGAARRLLERDQQVDDEQDEVIRSALARIQEDPTRSSQLVDLIQVAKNLERVADHATNIAELVLLIVEGRNVKHADKLARSAT